MGLVAVAALVVGIAMPAAAAVQPPAPAPSSDGESPLPLTTRPDPVSFLPHWLVRGPRGGRLAFTATRFAS